MDESGGAAGPAGMGDPTQKSWPGEEGEGSPPRLSQIGDRSLQRGLTQQFQRGNGSPVKPFSHFVSGYSGSASRRMIPGQNMLAQNYNRADPHCVLLLKLFRSLSATFTARPNCITS